MVPCIIKLQGLFSNSNDDNSNKSVFEMFREMCEISHFIDGRYVAI